MNLGFDSTKKKAESRKKRSWAFEWCHLCIGSSSGNDDEGEGGGGVRPSEFACEEKIGYLLPNLNGSVLHAEGSHVFVDLDPRFTL